MQEPDLTGYNTVSDQARLSSVQDVVYWNKDTLIPNLCRKSRPFFFLFFSDIGQSLVSLVEYTFMWLPGDCLVRTAETIWGRKV